MNMSRLRALAASVSVTLAIAAPLPVAAQQYPSKPVKVVVPFPGGGIVDVLTRIVVEKVAVNWGAPIIVEAKPGAGAFIGTSAVATAEPDGYTFLVATITGAVGPLLNQQFKYDLRKDFEAVGMFAKAPNLVVVPPSYAANSLADIVKLARERPGTLNYAHAGVGSTNHLPVEFLKVSRKLEIVPVAYKGQPQAITDVVGGQIQLFFGAPALLAPHVKAGRLKAIAVTSDKRLEDLPAVATLSEGGFGDVVGGSGWFGIVAPKGTRADIIERFNLEINKALKAPEVIERLAKAYAFPAASSPNEFSAFLVEEGARWTKLVSDANIPPQ